MPMRRWIAAFFLIFVDAGAASAADEPRGIHLGEATTSQWRFGLNVRAPAGEVSGILATLPVPMDWPEQQVRVVSEDKSPNARISYRQPGDGVKQLVISIPKLATGEEASVILTLDVTKRRILEPADPRIYVLPSSNPKLTKYL